MENPAGYLLFFKEQVWDSAGVLQVERKRKDDNKDPVMYDKTPGILRVPAPCPVLVPVEGKNGSVQGCCL